MFLRLFVLMIVICVAYSLAKVCGSIGEDVVLRECSKYPVDWFAGEEKIDSSDKFIISSVSNPLSSVLTISNFTIEDENYYSCREKGSGEMDNFTVVAPPMKIYEGNITTVYNGTALDINCGVLLGRITRNCPHGFMLLYGDQNTPKKIYYSDKVKYLPIGEETWLPSLMVSPTPDEYQSVRCDFSHDSSCGGCPCLSCGKGPLYKILYPPVVQITGSHANNNTVAEGTSIDLECNALEQNNISDLVPFNINWTIRDAKTDEIVEGTSTNNRSLKFTVTTDVVVTCSVEGEVNYHKIESSASIHLTVAPNLYKENVRLSMENCSSLLIHLNSSTEASKNDLYVRIVNESTIIDSNPQVIHLERALTDDKYSVLKMYFVVNGIKGNVYTQSIPTCNNSIITISFNNSWCAREQRTNEEIDGIISMFLINVTHVCVSDVCPAFNKHNWEIILIDNCDITVQFSGLPVEELENSLQMACELYGECRLLAAVESSTAPPTTEPPELSFNMLLIFMFICIPVLLLTVVVLSSCIFYKLIKNRIKRKKDVEQGKQNSDCNETATHTETNDRTMSTVMSGTCSYCNRSLASSDQQSLALSHGSHPTLPNKLVAHPSKISFNITVGDLPPPLLTLFNELGALECEKRTHSSVDTGVNTVDSFNSCSDGHSHGRQTSHNSSGYESRVTGEYNTSNHDPNLLNPHKRVGHVLQHTYTNTNTVTETML